MSRKLLAIIFLTSIAFIITGCERKTVPQNPVINTTSKNELPRKLENKIPTGDSNVRPINNANSNNSIGSNTFIASFKAEQKPIEILFIGDMMFDRYIRQVAAKRGNDFIFEGVKNLLADKDLVVGNLEGPLTDHTSVSVNTQMDQRENLIFTFPPSFAETLAKENIKLVNIGNNHILNFGSEGAAQTKKYLLAAGVNYFGDTGAAEKKYWIKEINGKKIGFINYNFSVKGSVQNALSDIKTVKLEADKVIVFPHWGTEYKTGDPGQAVKNIAHQFIDAGADLVIGTHPHVVQISEEYKGKKIYYSLGDFIFDQYFSPETQKGLSLLVKIKPDNSQPVEVEEIPVKLLRNGQTQLTK